MSLVRHKAFCVGDSNTIGFPGPKFKGEKTFPQLVGEKAGLEIDVFARVGASVRGGQDNRPSITSTPEYGRFLEAVRSFHIPRPSLVILCLGTNDLSMVRTAEELEDFRSKFAALADFCANVKGEWGKPEPCPIVVCAPLGAGPRALSSRSKIASIQREIVKDLRDRTVAYFVDIQKAIGVESYQPDKVHLCPSGHQALADCLAGTVAKCIPDPGIRNPGANCFANSLLQALFHTSYARTAIEKGGESTGSKLLRGQLEDAKKGAAAGAAAVPLRAGFRMAAGVGGGQQDAEEFFTGLLTKIGDGPLSEAFSSRFSQHARCQGCGIVTVAQNQTVRSLMAPLLYVTGDRKPGIDESIMQKYAGDDYIRKECIVGDHKKGFGETDHVTTRSRYELPKILAAVVCRFSDYKDKHIDRETMDVVAPAIFVFGQKLYGLRSVVERQGGRARSGHYVNYSIVGEPGGGRVDVGVFR